MIYLKDRVIAHNRVNAGFTLLEMLIYIALMSIVTGFAMGAVYSILEGGGRLNDKIVTEEEAHFLMRKIGWALTGIETINTPAVGATSTTLSIDKVNFADNPLVFDLSSGNVRLAKGIGSPVILNNQKVTIDGLTFRHIAPVGSAPRAVQVNLSVDGRQLETTIHLRK